MKNFLILFLAFFFVSFKNDDNIILDRNEAMKAFELLKQIRNKPSEFQHEYPFLSSTQVDSTKLKWNDTLCKVAEKKALDMAKKNYFAHIDPSGRGINHYINKSGYKLNSSWLKSKKANYFESLAAGVNDAAAAVSILLIDEGVPSKGHRVHLLGLDKWSASLKDVGIGFARCKTGARYKTYVCFIIAKHDW